MGSGLAHLAGDYVEVTSMQFEELNQRLNGTRTPTCRFRFVLARSFLLAGPISSTYELDGINEGRKRGGP